MLAWAFAFGAPRTLEMKDVRAETMSRETEKLALRARLAKIFACGAQKRVMLRLPNLTRKCATYSDSDPTPAPAPAPAPKKEKPCFLGEPKHNEILASLAQVRL